VVVLDFKTIIMKLIDTHCHLYLDELHNEINNVVERAESIGVQKFYFPAIDSTTHQKMLDTCKAFAGLCFPMMGLHPCSVKADFKNELKIAERFLNDEKFIAVGEIGLDFYHDKTFVKEQYEAFEMQMQWALQRGLPIVIHTRNAMRETIDFIKPFVSKGLKGVFHCFSGTETDAIEITELGFYLGIGGVVTYKKAGVAEAIQNISLDKIILETDAPYLTPVPFRGKPNESSFIKYVAEKLALIKNISADEVAAITSANAEKIFNN
jgi:TatD DNase family protein